MSMDRAMLRTVRVVCRRGALRFLGHARASPRGSMEPVALGTRLAILKMGIDRVRNIARCGISKTLAFLGHGEDVVPNANSMQRMAT